MNERIQGSYRDPSLRIRHDLVGFYPREFFMLDNFASFQVEVFGHLWPTSEHAYQASSFFGTAPSVVEEIKNARSAHDAFKTAQANKHLRPNDWDERKVGVMEEIVRAKLSQHHYIQQKLLQTGNVPIAEDSLVDYFWGLGADGTGQNQLGKIWMKLRDELKSGKISAQEPPIYRLD